MATVICVGLRRFDQWADGQSPSTIQNVMEEVVAQVAAAALEAGAVVLPETQDALFVLIGVERVTQHHALRGIFCAASIQARLDALRGIFHAKGIVFPEMQIGMDAGELTVNLPSVGGGSKRFVGRPLLVASRLREVAPGGQILMAETSLDYVMGSLPTEWEVSRARDSQGYEEDSSELLMDNIFPLPEELLGRRVRLGPGVKEIPGQAIFDFSYWRGVRIPGSQAALPVLRVATPQTEGIEFEIEETLPDPAHREFAFGKYRMIEKLGEGGMGEVWLARDRFGNRVAIKKLLPSLSVSPTQIKRFQREAAIMSRLAHRNICRIFEVGEVEGISYICMEYVDGVSLREILLHHTGEEKTEHDSFGSHNTDVSSLVKAVQEMRTTVLDTRGKQSPTTDAGEVIYRILPLTQTLAIFTRISEAMRYAHERGTLHRDLKPANIMVRSDGDPVVMDFGLAKMDMEHDRELSLSISGQIMGTMDYMAPEQARSAKDVTERADIYSLGAILYQMLVGRRHFESTGDLIHDAQALQVHEPVRPRLVNPLLDSDLEIITLKCLRPEVEGRYLTVGALLDDIERYRRGEPIAAKPVTNLELLTKLIRRNRAVSTVIGLALLLLVVFVLVLMHQLSESQKLERKASLAQIAAEEASREAEAKRREAEESQKKLAESLRKYDEAKSVGELLAVQAKQREKEAQTAVEAKNKAVEEVQEQKIKGTKDQNRFALGLVGQAERRMFDFDWSEAMRLAQEAAQRDKALAEPLLAMARVNLAMLNADQARIALDHARDKTSPSNLPEWQRLNEATTFVETVQKTKASDSNERADILGQLLGLLQASPNLVDAAVARYIEVKAPEVLSVDTSKVVASVEVPLSDEILVVADVVADQMMNGMTIGKMQLSAGESYPFLALDHDAVILWARKCQVRVPISSTNWKEWSAAREKAKEKENRTKVLDRSVDQTRARRATNGTLPSAPNKEPLPVEWSDKPLDVPVKPLASITLPSVPTAEDIRVYTASIMRCEEVVAGPRPRGPYYTGNGADIQRLADKLRVAARINMAAVLTYRAPEARLNSLFVSTLGQVVTSSDKAAVLGALRKNPNLYDLVRDNNWQDEARDAVREVVKKASGPLPWEMVVQSASFQDPELRTSLIQQLKVTGCPHEVYRALATHQIVPQTELNKIVEQLWTNRNPGTGSFNSLVIAATEAGQKEALWMAAKDFFAPDFRRYLGNDNKAVESWFRRMVPDLSGRPEQWPERIFDRIDSLEFDADSGQYRRVH
jgi:serine/threonine protein kinase/class 3 adenylate cyclase